MAYVQRLKRKDGSTSYKMVVKSKGKYISKTFRSRSAAREWGTKTENELLTQKDMPSEVTPKLTPSLSETIDRYIKYILPQKSKGTENKQRQILTWWKGTIGELQLPDMTPSLLERFKETLSDRLANATVNIYLDTLSHVFTVASSDAWAYMNDNPLLKVKRLPRDNGRVRYLTDTELENFLFFCGEVESKYFYPFVIISITTGLRKRNVLDLEFNQINFKRKEITVLTKNGEKHTVPLHPMAESAIRSLHPKPYNDLDNEDEIEAVLETRKYVFLNEMTGKPVRTIHVAWHVACEKAGIEDFRPHDLRHCFASYMALKGNANLQDIKQALGHKNIQQTMRYTHLTPSHMKELVNKTADKIFEAAKHNKH